MAFVYTFFHVISVLYGKTIIQNTNAIHHATPRKTATQKAGFCPGLYHGPPCIFPQ